MDKETRRQILDDMTKEADELGLYDIDARIIVTDEEWEAIQEVITSAPPMMPKLKALLEKPSPFGG